MRADTARYIEERANKPPGWLDQDHSGQGLLIRLADGRESPARAWEHPAQLPEVYTVFIPRFDVGQAPDGQVTIKLVTTEPQAFDAAFIKADQLQPTKLGYIEKSDDSMHPTIERGDKCVVDISQTQIVDGRTFAVYYDGACRLRRLFRLPGGGLRIEADNPRHAPITVPPEMASSITVLGRVVLRTGRGGL
ncbi:S24 family peptidase [Variovorax sp. PBS-H4]|uniref:S24 family peptidase n=1 Tax=Variovorax sp. PBS-H4 TaxID=434008 RepID=UPI0013A5B234|nr:S24 family peptidase [Variovorax sp. PBS-H4]